MREISKHFPHYAVLVGMFAAGFIGFVAFAYDTNFKIALSVSLATGYLAWGVVHHCLHRLITMSIILEYAAVSCLGLVILLSLL